MRASIEPVIDVCDVSRDFRSQGERPTLFGVLKDLVRRTPAETPVRHALRDVSLTARRGDKIAIVGNNAAGKSTLLKIIAGLLRPTRGAVTIRGEIVLLTSLGVGMMDEVSVLDNALLYGALYGIEPARIRAVFDEIMEWAGTAGYDHARLKTLSAGTRARLAFSIVRYIATDVFLIDEALSAGDLSFRAKCRAFFDEPRNHERTFLVATHDMEFAQSFCTLALWLHEGRVMDFGESRTVVTQYVAAQSAPPGRTARSGALVT